MRAIREVFQALRLQRRANRLEKRPTPHPVLNEALLRQVLIHIELFPQDWDQSRWACGTQACLAGWTVALSGKPVDLRVLARIDGDAILALAKERLGLDATQAEKLFYFGAYTQHPSFAELCERVEQVTGIVYKPTPALTEADYAFA